MIAAPLAALFVVSGFLPALAAVPEEDILAEATCPVEQIAAILDSAAYRDAHARLAVEPAFVDLFIGHDGVHPVATAVFDAERVAGLLPAVLVTVDDIPVQVVAEHITTLPGDAAPAPPLIPQTCPNGIRPGARMDAPSGCTFNFIYTDQFGRFYIGTAGHCATELGATASAGGVGSFGTVIFTTGSGGVGNDFALIRVNADKNHLVEPEMCHWGGPTGLGGGGSTSVHHYGWGIGYGTLALTRPRTGFLAGASSTSFAFTGTAIFGDSGSPVIADSGLATGTLTHGGVGFIGNTFGTRADHGIALAEQATGLQFTLQTAPLA